MVTVDSAKINSMSLSVVVIVLYRPPDTMAKSRSSSSSSTTPRLVESSACVEPMPRIEIGYRLSAVSRKSPKFVIPSVNKMIRPRSWPNEMKRSFASLIAAATLLPRTGIISGSREGSKFRILLLSLVSGVTTYASPANTTSADNPSSRRARMSLTLNLARSILLG